MKYSVFSTDIDNHVGYINHRGEFVSVSVCWDYEQACRHAEKLNMAQRWDRLAQDMKQQTGNRYMRRYVRR